MEDYSKNCGINSVCKACENALVEKSFIGNTYKCAFKKIPILNHCSKFRCTGELNIPAACKNCSVYFKNKKLD